MLEEFFNENSLRYIETSIQRTTNKLYIAFGCESTKIYKKLAGEYASQNPQVVFVNHQNGERDLYSNNERLSYYSVTNKEPKNQQG